MSRCILGRLSLDLARDEAASGKAAPSLWTAVLDLPSMINHMPGNPPDKEAWCPPFTTSGPNNRQLIMGCRHKCIENFTSDSIQPLLHPIFFNILHFPADPFEVTRISHPYVIDNSLKISTTTSWTHSQLYPISHFDDLIECNPAGYQQCLETLQFI